MNDLFQSGVQGGQRQGQQQQQQGGGGGMMAAQRAFEQQNSALAAQQQAFVEQQQLQRRQQQSAQQQQFISAQQQNIPPQQFNQQQQQQARQMYGGYGMMNQQQQQQNGQQGGAAPPHIDMRNVSPANFRPYILYVRHPRRNPNTGELYDPDPFSTKALKDIAPIEQEIWVQNIAEIPKEQRPKWLDGTPILVALDIKRCYRGSQCFAQIQKLRAVPMGISFSQEEGYGFSVDSGGGFTEGLDRVEPSVAEGARYLGKGKTTGADVDYYTQLRSRQDAAFGNAKPSPAQAQAIVASMNTNGYQ